MNTLPLEVQDYLDKLLDNINYFQGKELDEAMRILEQFNFVSYRRR